MSQQDDAHQLGRVSRLSEDVGGKRQYARLSPEVGRVRGGGATAHKLARILYNLMRHGIAYMNQEEAAYAEQVRERLAKLLHCRAKEPGYERKPIVATVAMPDGEVLTVMPDDEIIDRK